MATLNIEGRTVNVDDSFLKLPPDQQHATVDEIAKSFAGTPSSFAERFDAAPKKPQPTIVNAVTDIPQEVSNASTQAIQHLTGNSVEDLPGYDKRTRGELGPIEGLARTGKQVLGVPELLAALPTGLARSVIGHLMTQGEHWVGSIIAPDRAAKDDLAQMYDTSKGDVDTAMSAVRPAGAPVKVAGPSVTTTAPNGATAITVAPKAAYEWAAPSAAAPKPPTIPELKAGASKNYESPALVGLEVKPASIGDFATKAKVDLNAGGIDENLAPKTFAILSKLEKVPDSPAAIVTGNNIKSLRQLLGNAAGEPGKEGLAASRALNALDEHIPAIEPKDVLAGDPKAASEALNTANADYSAAMHAQTIDNKTIKAQLRASAANSGQNVANTIRQRMADILDPERPDRQRGFTPDELAMMKQIVEGTKTQNALRWAGNYLGGGGGLGALHTSGAGAAAGAAIAGPAGAAVGAVIPPALGYVLKAIGNRGTLVDAAKLSEMIRSRAPLASSVQKYEDSASRFSVGKTAKTYAAMLIASRNLSNNLRSVGLNVSASDLMSGMQPASAQDQDQVDGPAP